MMHPENLETIKALFEAVIVMPPDSRPAFLSNNCADPGVREQVLRLVSQFEQADSSLSVRLFLDGVDGRVSAPRFKDRHKLDERFTIVSFIGEGGMGEVYEAEDSHLGTKVALKTLRPGLIREQTAINRFKREVRLARRVTDENVCRIYDIHQITGTETLLFLSMELLRGMSLSGKLKYAGPLSQEESLPLIKDMAQGLSAAHGVHIVHRDFKPGNVVLVVRDHVVRAVITDFGLAAAALPSAQIEGNVSLTSVGHLMGTPAYMAPEQVRGEVATVRSDIYAFGLVIYEMVTGVRPFQCDTPSQEMMRRLHVPPKSPKLLKSDLSPSWEVAILRCLQQDPEKRFQTVAEVAKEFELDRQTNTTPVFHKDAVSSQGSLAIATEQRTNYKSTVRIFGIVALLACAGLLGYWLLRKQSFFYSRQQPFFFSEIIPLPIIDQRSQTGAIAAAHLGNSRKLDLIALNAPFKPRARDYDVGTVSVLSDVGIGGFQSATTYQAGRVPYGIAVADFNNDGDEDVAVTNIGTYELTQRVQGTLTVFLGKENGTLQEVVHDFPIGNTPTVPAVGDFNEDGRLDLAVGSWTDGTVKILLGNGDGTFSEGETYKLGISDIACVVAGHFDSQGHVDLAIANNQANEVVILLGIGNGKFKLPPIKIPTGPPRPPLATENWWGAYGILVWDLDEDGHDDLAVTNFSDGSVGVLLGNGDGTFKIAKTFPTDPQPFSLAVADFNGDGKADLVTANNSRTISVLLGNGDGTFQPKLSPPYKTGGSSTSMVVGDFNGDGKEDLAIANRDKNYIGLMLNSVNVIPTFTHVYVIGNPPITQGFPVTIKATVKTSSSRYPEGRVQFRTKDQILATMTLDKGEAWFKTSLNRGSQTITALYIGTGRYTTSSDKMDLNVQ
jgi:serine/threonine protein kinase